MPIVIPTINDNAEGEKESPMLEVIVLVVLVLVVVRFFLT